MSLSSLAEELKSKVGQQISCSDWYTVTQDAIDAFAQATGDHQWIHEDRARCARESPHGKPIAHGYLILSLYPMLRGLIDEHSSPFPGVKRVINYGINKLRFPNSVPVDTRVRGRTVLVSVEDVPDGLQLVESHTVEIEGATKPACIGEVIMRLYFQ